MFRRISELDNFIKGKADQFLLSISDKRLYSMTDTFSEIRLTNILNINSNAEALLLKANKLNFIKAKLYFAANFNYENEALEIEKSEVQDQIDIADRKFVQAEWDSLMEDYDVHEDGL